MVLVCLASMVIPVLAAIGIARGTLERISIWLTAVPFTFFGQFVMVEFWGEIEPASYVAGAFSTLAVVCAFVLSFLAAASQRHVAAAVGSRRPRRSLARRRHRRTTPAGWYPDPGGVHHQRYWDGSAGRRRRTGPLSRGAGADAREECEGVIVGDDVCAMLDRECGQWASVVRLSAVRRGAAGRGTRRSDALG